MADPVDRIATNLVPPPAGHYSEATAWRDLVFTSGQLAPRPDGTTPPISRLKSRCARHWPTCWRFFTKLTAGRTAF